MNSVGHVLFLRGVVLRDVAHVDDVGDVAGGLLGGDPSGLRLEELRAGLGVLLRVGQQHQGRAPVHPRQRLLGERAQGATGGADQHTQPSQMPPSTKAWHVLALS